MVDGNTYRHRTYHLALIPRASDDPIDCLPLYPALSPRTRTVAPIRVWTSLRAVQEVLHL